MTLYYYWCPRCQIDSQKKRCPLCGGVCRMESEEDE